ncbi:protease complex subunit PrcB family protein [Aminivibrio sp.]|uniref:protease complex subunit PrcB family protein n=1 Tax=Aminivibrio sp. TaxID=1872489 RepID=UPI001A54154F|nr:protease complex subunit PrcB family protein [Aminivibrio sp.]MBL3540664.1 protease complex subunit PrcB family protein [Aminivibrio sp.]MDK2959672.1 hypothetical protein [Synergistaceae bacterium]
MKNVAALVLFLFTALMSPVNVGMVEAFAACGDDDGEVVAFVPVGKGSYGGVNDRRFMVVKSPDEWKELWGEINGNVLPLPPLPEIDFSRQALAAVFQGLKRTGGYSISVEAIIETGDRVTVFVREQEPGPQNLVTMALSSPWEVVVFPLPQKPVLFTSIQ